MLIHLLIYLFAVVVIIYCFIVSVAIMISLEQYRVVIGLCNLRNHNHVLNSTESVMVAGSRLLRPMSRNSVLDRGVQFKKICSHPGRNSI